VAQHRQQAPRANKSATSPSVVALRQLRLPPLPMLHNKRNTHRWRM
jgi:hypothetical protein